MADNATDPARAFLGVGWAFPVRLAAGGAIAEAVFDADIAQAIRIILLTSPGERVMRPDFGAGLNDFVFEPVSVATIERVKARVTAALVAWEPRIDVLDVTVTTDPATRNCLLIDMSYRVRATNTRQNLVYPFFLEEGTTA
jgi:phage baseplate assembly protein W